MPTTSEDVRVIVNDHPGYALPVFACSPGIDRPVQTILGTTTCFALVSVEETLNPQQPDTSALAAREAAMLRALTDSLKANADALYDFTCTHCPVGDHAISIRLSVTPVLYLQDAPVPPKRCLLGRLRGGRG